MIQFFQVTIFGLMFTVISILMYYVLRQKASYFNSIKSILLLSLPTYLVVYLLTGPLMRFSSSPSMATFFARLGVTASILFTIETVFAALIIYGGLAGVRDVLKRLVRRPTGIVLFFLVFLSILVFNVIIMWTRPVDLMSVVGVFLKEPYFIIVEPMPLPAIIGVMVFVVYSLSLFFFASRKAESKKTARALNWFGVSLVVPVIILFVDAVFVTRYYDTGLLSIIPVFFFVVLVYLFRNVSLLEEFAMAIHASKSVERVPTGIKGLDDLLEGGIPIDTWFLTIMDPAFDRIRFNLQFLEAGLKNNEGFIYCNILKSVQEIRDHCNYFGIDISKYEAKGQTVFVNSYNKEKNDENIINVPPDNYLELSFAINTAIEKLSKWKSSRGVCPSTGDSLLKMDKEAVFKFSNSRREIRRKYLTVSMHTLVKGTRDDLLESLKLHADGVIEIESKQTPKEIKYYLRITKMKFTNHPTKQYPLKIVNGRFELITK